jgi:hypothetical protein
MLYYTHVQKKKGNFPSAGVTFLLLESVGAAVTAGDYLPLLQAPGNDV